VSVSDPTSCSQRKRSPSSWMGASGMDAHTMGGRRESTQGTGGRSCNGTSSGRSGRMGC
jgi:hypothetical protein